MSQPRGRATGGSRDQAPTDAPARVAAEAPHRRRDGAPRVVELATVLAYRSLEWLLGHLPARPAWTVGGWIAQASYLAWPSRRRWVNRNFGHVLGADPDSPAVRRLALAAYRNYARYLVELMRLASIRPAEAADVIDIGNLGAVEAIRASASSIILVVGHLGNNEAVAAGFAQHGWPVSVVADDSTFPELFEHLRRQRASWGVTLIPWRNLRQVFGVLRSGEILGLLVDWGYKSDGIPVRLFGAWTMLPAGPAVLAARTGATILPVTVRRHAGGRFAVEHGEPFTVPSSDPRDLAVAMQRVAAELERAIAAAPEQWYSFKPMWPEEPAEIARLTALAQLTGTGPGAAAATVAGAAAPVDEAGAAAPASAG